MGWPENRFARDRSGCEWAAAIERSGLPMEWSGERKLPRSFALKLALKIRLPARVAKDGAIPGKYKWKRLYIGRKRTVPLIILS